MSRPAPRRSNDKTDEKLGEPLLSPAEDLEAAVDLVEKKAAEDAAKTKSLVISFILMVGIGLGNKIFQVPSRVREAAAVVAFAYERFAGRCVCWLL